MVETILFTLVKLWWLWALLGLLGWVTLESESELHDHDREFQVISGRDHRVGSVKSHDDYASGR